MSSTLYPRTITLYRPTTSGSATGVQTVQEYTLAQMTRIAVGIACSIQYSVEGGRPLGDEPGDVRTRQEWAVYVPIFAASSAGLNAPGLILARDTLIDDAGAKYQIAQASWDVLGWQIRAELLAA
jgi:hypothetical protein